MEDPNAELFPALRHLDYGMVRAELDALSSDEIRRIKHGAYGLISIAEDLLGRRGESREESK